MLFITTISTLITVYFAGHLSDRFGRVYTLGGACWCIAAALAAFGLADGIGFLLVFASVALGSGWGLTYALAPIVLTRLVTTDGARPLLCYLVSCSYGGIRFVTCHGLNDGEGWPDR